MLGSQLGAQPTLESNQWFGAQGNRLWLGLVEGDGNLLVSGEELIDRNGSNRVKVRIMGYHTRSRTKLPPKDLPWASVMIPATETVTTTNAGITHGLAIGSWVLGTFGSEYVLHEHRWAIRSRIRDLEQAIMHQVSSSPWHL